MGARLVGARDGGGTTGVMDAAEPPKRSRRPPGPRRWRLPGSGGVKGGEGAAHGASSRGATAGPSPPPGTGAGGVTWPTRPCGRLGGARRRSALEPHALRSEGGGVLGGDRGRGSLGSLGGRTRPRCGWCVVLLGGGVERSTPGRGAAARPPTSANLCGAIPGGTARSVTNRDDQDWLLRNRSRCASPELVIKRGTSIANTNFIAVAWR